ncbi:MAG TPA: lysophospholipase [Candidatus Faecousia excrementipullorum]|nr:lysophospholipase [Candidatus Faecousia excrementipullorum]
MREDFYFDSCGKGRIHCCRWLPEGEVKGVLQIVHGIAEHVGRYTDFAEYMNAMGYLVVAEDHMGHGRSVAAGQPYGYFYGGWFSAVKDTHTLLMLTKKEYPNVPYFLLGHSMGSFMTRTLLARYPDCGLTGCILSGTGGMAPVVLKAGKKLLQQICRRRDETKPNPKLQRMAFGTYNMHIEHPRTPFDWLTRDKKIVDAYMEDPLCGFVASSGLFRDMITGMDYMQDKKNLAKMDKNLPVLFVSGKEDPVGSYGKGVEKAASSFREAGVIHVSFRLYPLCRHELLNEINRLEIYKDLAEWIAETAASK